MNHGGGSGVGGGGGAANAWGNGGEAYRWLDIAGRLLQARDLVGGKRFAERALEVDPLVEGVDEILAVADVIIASQRRIKDQLDWYAVLQLDGSSTPEIPALKQAYRRLALVLQSDKNHYSGADRALQLVTDAWTFLSDPDRKRLLDDEIKRAAGLGLESSQKPRAPSPPPAPESFWTMCPSCYRAYGYEKVHQGRMLRCQSCKKPFQATELSSSPPIVPGTDFYYCSWGLYPLGFPGCPMFNGVSLPPGIPHFTLHPSNQTPPSQTSGDHGKHNATVENDNKMKTDNTRNNDSETVINAVPQAAAPPESSSVPRKRGRPRKVLAQKPRTQVATEPERGSHQPIVLNFEQQNQHMGGEDFAARTQHTAQNVAYMGGGFDMNRFSIDLDATSEVLGNLAHLPFLKDDEAVILH